MRNSIDNLLNELKNENPNYNEFFTISESISNIITKIVVQRNNLKISQRDLAKMTGLKQSAIARLESLNSIPRIDTLVKICYHLNLEIDLATVAEINNKHITFLQIGNKVDNNFVYNTDYDDMNSTPTSYVSENCQEEYKHA